MAMHQFDPRRGHVWLVILSVSLLMSMVAHVEADEEAMPPCSEEPIGDLPEFLEAVASSSRSAVAAERRHAGELQRLARSSLLYDTSLTLLSEMDAGQRARPSDEYAFGPGARGEFAAELLVPLVDVERRHLRDARRARADGYSAQRDADRIERQRRALGHLDEAQLLSGAVQGWSSLAREAREDRALLERRVEHGLSSAHVIDEVEDEAAFYEERLTILRVVRRAHVERAAILAGRCSEEELASLLERYVPSGSSADGGVEMWDARRQQAHALALESERVRHESALLLEGMVRVGGHLSATFDSGFREEWIGGIRFAWRPDLMGVREANAAAGRLDAMAVEAEAEELRDEVLHERAALRAEIDEVERRVESLGARLAARQARVTQQERRAREGLVDREEGVSVRQTLRALRDEMMETEVLLWALRARLARLPEVQG